MKQELDLSKVTRLEVIGKQRLYVGWDIGPIEISMQDDGRTMKVFISEKP